MAFAKQRLIKVLDQACTPVAHAVGGGPWPPPEDLDRRIGNSARELINQAFEGIEPGALIDHHAHLVAMGTLGDGTWLNPSMTTWRRPLDRIKALIYLQASGISDETQADSQFQDRLIRLVRAIKGYGKTGLLAFDYHYGPNGRIDKAKSGFYISNDTVFALAKAHPDIFFPICSVHPYREDAIAELDRCAAQGARIVKWLPNVMGMDASASRCEPYFERMKALGLVLLTHVGEEEAVKAGVDQSLGNPLLFRKPLDMGLKVIMAHCANLGANADLDNGGREAENFDLFIRMMGDSKYAGLLFADISATTQANNLPRPLLTLLERSDLHPRLINGSDYPLPAVNVFIWLRLLVKHGMITAQERQDLGKIYTVNPLLFDFVLKRALRHPKNGGHFPASLFGSHTALPIA